MALKGLKGSLTPIRCDVSKEEEILLMFERIKQELGGVDVCINNAGLGHDAPLLSGATQDWRHMLDVRTCEYVFSVVSFVIPKEIYFNFLLYMSLRKHACSTILKILPPKNENFQISILIFFFLYFSSKHRLWVLVRTASARQF